MAKAAGVETTGETAVTAAAAEGTTVRFVALHGWRMTGPLLKKILSKTQATAARVSKGRVNVEFICPNATFELPTGSTDGDKTRSWWDSQQRSGVPPSLLADSDDKPASATDDSPSSDAKYFEYEGLAESLKRVLDLVFAEDQPEIAGLFGFSQGAMLSTAIAAMFARPAHFEKHLGIQLSEERIKQGRNLKLWLVGGMQPRDYRVKCVLSSDLKLSNPAALVFGESDTVVKPEWTAALAELFDAETAKPVSIPHPRGHIIPSDDSVVQGCLNALFPELMTIPED